MCISAHWIFSQLLTLTKDFHAAQSFLMTSSVHVFTYYRGGRWNGKSQSQNYKCELLCKCLTYSHKRKPHAFLTSECCFPIPIAPPCNMFQPKDGQLFDKPLFSNKTVFHIAGKFSITADHIPDLEVPENESDQRKHMVYSHRGVRDSPLLLP